MPVVDRALMTYSINVPKLVSKNNTGLLMPSSKQRLNLSVSSCYSSKGKKHANCLKCSRGTEIHEHGNGPKLMIKTAEIFRSENLIQPKTYLRITDGHTQQQS